jgi:starvation-inducible outer membrane lipoprotein
MKTLNNYAAVFSIALAGCATTPNPASVGPAPANYKEQVKQYIQRTLFDPYSIRGAAITQPFPKSYGFSNIWAVCVEMNAKNRYGAYTGLQRMGFYFQQGQITNSEVHVVYGFCYDKSLVFTPWPEVEQMK